MMNFDDKVKALQAQFPTAGITGGYIGNCSAHFDDRSWMIFTTVVCADRNSWGEKVRVKLHISGPQFDLAEVTAQLGRLLNYEKTRRETKGAK